jgi:uncharacterized protein (DUF1778 family)
MVTKRKQMKNSKLVFRISTSEKDIIKAKAKLAGLTNSEYCRRAALNKIIVSRFTERQEKMYKNFINYHNHFTNISNLIKSKDPQLNSEIMKLVEFFKLEINSFKK